MAIDIDKVQGFINMDDRLFPEYRQKIYTYLKNTLSSVVTDWDLDIMVELVAMIFGDLYLRAETLPWMIDIDKCPDEYLEALSSLIGYRWNNCVTPDAQRESVKLYCLIRRWRGSKFGLENLIRVFGQDTKTYYSSADLRGVEIIEYGSGGPETTEPNMYPGDIKVRIPELSKILRDSIFDTKLAGTRLIFSYYIFMGVYHMHMYVDFAYIIKYWINLLYSNFDPIIEKYGAKYLSTTLDTVLSDQLTHAVVRGRLIASMQILTYYKKPWDNGFIFNTKGLTNYRGFIEPDPTIESDHILYK